MSAYSKVAVRYANALYSLSVEQGITDKVLADMENFALTAAAVPEFKAMLKSPVIRKDQKISAIHAIFPGNSALTKAFIEKLTKSNREQSLEDISKAFIKLYNTKKGILIAEVVTAGPLDSGIRAQMEAIIRRSPEFSAATQVVLAERIDPNMIGGFKLTVGDKQINSSFADSMVKLTRAFNENLYIKEF